ncbi:hypothetical protein B9J78_05335 [bacterium Unc6]|nr:hypothetical protein [bacterium Unc6]
MDKSCTEVSEYNANNMKIGVLSDIHIHKGQQTLPKKLVDALYLVDMILMAGDFVDVYVLNLFKSLPHLEAVHGNMDSSEIINMFSSKKIIKVEEIKIGLIHGNGHPQELPEKVMKEFEKDCVQVIVFGHSHNPYNRIINGVLLFNPGSPTDKIYSIYNSYGILEVNKNKVRGKIIRL